MSTGYLFGKDHPSDGRMKLFDKLVTEDEMKKQECQPFVLKDIFSADKLKYINDIKKVLHGEIEIGTDDSWFYTDEDLLHFLEDEQKRHIEENEQITDTKETKVKTMFTL